jgi:hypothetical protein
MRAAHGWRRVAGRRRLVAAAGLAALVLVAVLLSRSTGRQSAGRVN